MRKPLSVRLDSGLVEQVKSEAARRGQKVTKFVELALVAALLPEDPQRYQFARTSEEAGEVARRLRAAYVDAKGSDAVEDLAAVSPAAVEAVERSLEKRHGSPSEPLSPPAKFRFKCPKATCSYGHNVPGRCVYHVNLRLVDA